VNIGWAVFVFISLAVLLRRLYRRRIFHRVVYTRAFKDDALFAGESTEMVETIENRKLLPMPWVRAESRMDRMLRFPEAADRTIRHGLYHQSVFALMPYTRITRRHPVQAVKRGLYRLDSVTLTAGDPLMLTEATRTIELTAHLTVYPRLLPEEKIPLPCHSLLGDITLRRWIVPDPFLRAGTRPYEPGDGLHNVHWKATARAGALQVHRSEYTAAPRLMILFNVDTTPDLRDKEPEPDRVEYGLSLAATIADSAVRRGIPVGLLTNARCIGRDRIVRIPCRCSKEHLVGLCQTLASVQIQRSVTIYTLLEQEIGSRPTGTDYLLITAYQDARLAAQVTRLRELGNAVQTVKLPNVPQGEGVEHGQGA
jgi:uncharacterized protein (DUF58 family)